MRIDIHGHMGAFDGRVSTPEETARYVEDAAIDHLLISNLDAASLGTGASNDDETDANLACLRLCASNPKLAPLYWVRLGRVDSNVRAFSGAMSVEDFVGAYFSAPLSEFDAGDKCIDAYLSVLARLKRPALFDTSPEDHAIPARAYAAARRHVGVVVILTNAGGEPHWEEAVDVVRVARQREDARLYLSTTRASTADIVAAVEQIGANQLMFGSDATHFGPQHAEYVLERLERLREALDPRDYARITETNALACFPLK